MTFTVTVSTSQVLAAAARLEDIDGPTLNALLTRAVNSVAGKFDTRARRAMNAGIALDDGYISSRMEFQRGAGVPQAEITAAGPGRAGRKGLTILGHYSPVKSKEGVTVEVTRGSPKLIRTGFTLPLKNTDGKTGVFTREGGKLRHRYGVSPYSLFRFQITKGEGVGLDQELQTAVLAEMGAL